MGAPPMATALTTPRSEAGATTLWHFECAGCGAELRPPEIHPRWAKGGRAEEVSHGICRACRPAEPDDPADPYEPGEDLDPELLRQQIADAGGL